MKICFVVDNLDRKKGWGRLAGTAADYIEKAGNQVGFVIQSGAPAPGVMVLKLGTRTLKDLFSLPARLLRLRNFFKGYDVVLCYDVNPYGIMASVASLGLRTKVVIHALATYSLFGEHTPLRNTLMRWAYRRAARVLYVSDFLKRQIERMGFVLKNSALLPVGVDTHFFTPDAQTQDRGSYILSVGALKERKGFHVSIAAFAELAAHVPKMKYIIIGSQDNALCFNHLQSQVHDLGLDERVVFIDHVSDAELVEYYRGAKLFLLTPLTTKDAVEGFGMVYLEAAACGIPTVGTSGTGAEAAIVDGKTGYLALQEPGDIARVIQKVLVDEEHAVDLGSEGRRHALRFDWKRIAEMYLEEFQKVAS
jgi:phosphatidylinositol alpha-1,6-mannosyltransferase